MPASTQILKHLERRAPSHNASLISPLVRAACFTLSLPYLAAIQTRNLLFDKGLYQPRRLPHPVISIGNLTTGGTGKTPFVLHTARLLSSLHKHPAILTRGYQPDPNAKTNFSDEAQLLQAALGASAHVQVNPNRYQGGLDALQSHPATDSFIMDDGFQHRRLYRDLDIVLLDASMDAGLWHLLPRGLFREPASSLARAAMVIITRADQVSEKFSGRLDLLESWVTRHHGKYAAGRAIHDWDGYLDAHDKPLPPDALKPHNHILAFCALGNPQAFFDTARLNASPSAQTHTFTLPDHHTFPSWQAFESQILTPAKEKNACLLTTEKDWIKLKPLIPQSAMDSLPPIRRPKLTLKFIHGPDPLPQALQTLFQPAPTTPSN